MSVYSLNNHQHLPRAAISPRSLTHESSPTESEITITQTCLRQCTLQWDRSVNSIAFCQTNTTGQRGYLWTDLELASADATTSCSSGATVKWQHANVERWSKPWIVCWDVGYWQKNASYGTYQQRMTEQLRVHMMLASDSLMLDDGLDMKKMNAVTLLLTGV